MHLSLITINIVISQKYFYCTGKYYYCTWKYYYCTGKYNHCTGKYYYCTGKYYYVTGNIKNSCENIIIHIWKYHNVSSPSTSLLYQAKPTPGMALSVHWFVRHVFTSSNTHLARLFVWAESHGLRRTKRPQDCFNRNSLVQISTLYVHKCIYRNPNFEPLFIYLSALSDNYAF